MFNNAVWLRHPVDQQIRAEQKSQQSRVIWFTGFRASGKSTIASAFEQILTQRN
jgi:adenylylsulfate kinase-like enzyme